MSEQKPSAVATEAWAVFDQHGAMDFGAIGADRGAVVDDFMEGRTGSWGSYIDNGYTCRKVHITEAT